MIVGPANCGKTFMLNPLCSIFNCFEIPASTTFAWVGAESAEIIFLNDLRWSPQLISWNDFLLMREGHTVQLPAPKTHYAKDLVLKEDTLIFSTSSQKLTYVRHGIVD